MICQKQILQITSCVMEFFKRYIYFSLINLDVFCYRNEYNFKSVQCKQKLSGQEIITK
jgi:hypothetical protein